MPHVPNIILLGLDSDNEEIRSLQSDPPRQVAPKVESEVIIEISIS
jgi:hypothetical protein